MNIISHISDTMKHHKIKSNLQKLTKSSESIQKQIDHLQEQDIQEDIKELHISRLKLEQEKIGAYFEEVRKQYNDFMNINKSKDLWKVYKPITSSGSIFITTKGSSIYEGKKHRLYVDVKPKHTFADKPSPYKAKAIDNVNKSSLKQHMQDAFKQHFINKKNKHILYSIQRHNIPELKDLAPSKINQDYIFLYHFLNHCYYLLYRHEDKQSIWIEEEEDFLIPNNKITLLKYVARHFNINIIIEPIYNHI